ncbi:HU family DNA-binding protein [Sulfurisoma sediminicola]|uniref:DNA-binding protein HU-beta n=1 Tax=Sulfurisoma sediminicola TaxID=1381557 RepID=A0A497XCS9_9PROT|nr:HU family DNA-binding protein [Sulfurisoma sediminicola]RLJ64772.1 DNA-binding protein HU-beta [Sulfurisoma sediminicola]
MNKRQLIDAVAEKANASKAAADIVVSAAIEAIAEAIARGESVQFVGFGTFSVAERKARSGRNPQTGKEILIPASQAVRFKAGARLNAAVNKGKRKK